MKSPVVLKRRQIIALISLMAACVGGAAGLWLGGMRSSGFIATASVVINPIPGNTFWDDSVDDTITLQTEAQQARSDAVLTAVVDGSDLVNDIDVLRRRTSVSTVTNSEVIRLSYRGGSAKDAVAVADALAHAALDRRRALADTAMETQIATVKDAIGDVTNELQHATDRAAERVLTQRRVVLRTQLRGLQEKSLVPGDVLGVTAQSASRRTTRIGLAGIGAVAGALVGLWVGRRVVRRKPSESTVV